VAGTRWDLGYGKFVIVDHKNGFVTLYANLNSILVKRNQSVEAGQQIGTVGDTGDSMGPHLHFEIRYNGVRLNPLEYLP
jgi:murein DD-endopeptidase MepM/ murein hydrolase activator NlpD